MKHQTKFTPQEQQKQPAVEQQARQSSTHEFAGVEELLRHDALHTPVPPEIAQRLEQSIGAEPRPGRPWWRRLFGGH